MTVSDDAPVGRCKPRGTERGEETNAATQGDTCYMVRPALTDLRDAASVLRAVADAVEQGELDAAPGETRMLLGAAVALDAEARMSRTHGKSRPARDATPHGNPAS